MANRREPPPDPEFDTNRGPTVRLREFDPIEHHRIVVNPFLAVAALTAWGWLLARLLDGPYPALGLVALPALVFAPVAVQYHCLDCGRTGSYPLRRSHACPGVTARWREKREDRSWLPTARMQLIFWVYAVGIATVVNAVAGSSAWD